MTIVELNCIEAKIKKTPIIQAIELKNIGFLEKQPTQILCPACQNEALTNVRQEVVTCLQRFVNATKLCKNWQGRYDINHYCSKCGCYIGRYVSIGCSERCLSRSARKMAAVDDMRLKTKPKDCAEHMQCARERILAKRAQQKAEKERQQKQQEQEEQAVPPHSSN